MIMQEEMARAKSLQDQMKALKEELDPLKERFLEALIESEAVEQGLFKLKLVNRDNVAYKDILEWIKDKECTYLIKGAKVVQLNSVIGSVQNTKTTVTQYALVQD